MGRKSHTVRSRYIRSAEDIIKRVESQMTKSQQIENTLAKAGRLATSYNSYEGTEALIAQVRSYIATGKRLSQGLKYKVAVLKERSSESYWTSGIKMSYYKTKQRGHNKVAVDAQISVADVNKMKKRYDKEPAKTTQEEYKIITRYHSAISPISNARAMGATPQELADLRRQKMNRMEERDVSFGGSSTLINDLAYSAGAESVGRDFVEAIQEAMKDPQVYEAIENWYRTEGDDVRRALDNATGSNWYENFCEARQAIITAINLIKQNVKLPQDTIDQLDSIVTIADNLPDYEN